MTVRHGGTDMNAEWFDMKLEMLFEMLSQALCGASQRRTGGGSSLTDAEKFKK